MKADVGDTLDDGDENGHMLGQTPGHDGVHGDGGRRGLTLARGEHGDDLIRAIVGVPEHSLDALLSGRDYWQAIGPAPGEEKVARRFCGIGYLKGFGIHLLLGSHYHHSLSALARNTRLPRSQ